MVRDWRRDAVLLVALGAGLTLLFFDARLDLAAARPFYRALIEDRFPLGRAMPWSLLYLAAPWITAMLVLAGLATLAASVVRKRDGLRRHAVFVLLSVALGPGLLVNGVFKDHWNRPRPRDIVEFGGALHYAPAPLRGEGGKSFPCGHCSVGFLYGIGWWIWRRRRPAWAAASLATGIIAGTTLGIGRIAAGGHFLSDIVWSAFIALGIAHVLYHYVLRIPAHAAEDAPAAPPVTPGARATWWLAALAALAGAAVLVALFAAPHGAPIAAEIPLASLPANPKLFELQARIANVDITLVDAPPQVSISGELHGFGLPGSRLSADARFESRPIPVLRYVVEESGWITDLDANVTIRLPAGELERVVVQLDQGNISIVDATAARVVESGRLTLDARTGKGQVRLPGR